MTKHRIKWAEHVARMRERRSAGRDLVGKPESEMPLGKLKRRSESIKLGLKHEERAETG